MSNFNVDGLSKGVLPASDAQGLYNECFIAVDLKRKIFCPLQIILSFSVTKQITKFHI
jgi:hypothetical protein